MKTKDRILKSKGQFVSVSWKSSPKPKSEFKHLSLEKRTRAVVRAGIDYRNLSINKNRETEPLPWGQWKQFPYVIEHNGKEYIRLYPNNKPESDYFIDGKRVDREEFLSKLPESQKKKEAPACFVVAEENLIENE